MNLRLVLWLTTTAATCLAAALPAFATERNVWPFWVEHTSEDNVNRWGALGPFIYGSGNTEGDRLRGLRPLLHDLTAADGSRSRSFIYPLWYREYDAASDESKWTILNLINSRSGSGNDDRFSVWPLYFSRDTGEAETSYRALFPLYGDISQRFGQYRLKWAPFPLYVRYESDGAVITSTPWPFIKSISGDNHRGFEVWPLWGQREEIGVSSRQYMLWPLIYRRRDNLDTDESSHRVGILPFYAAESSAGYESRTYGWPFFGYSRRTYPVVYKQTNFFWPLWVQGRGEERYVNRWAPFYSRSVTPSRDQTWALWPVWRDRRWSSEHLDHQRQQLLYFVYHSEVQTSRQSPDLDPAVKRHLWPVLSQWDNGAGRVQFQALSPIEVFFPHNERMRQLWSPLFALYRFDQQSPGEFRHSLLWDTITYARSEDLETKEFHLGPLFNYTAAPSGKTWGLLGGLFKMNFSSAGELSATSALFPDHP